MDILEKVKGTIVPTVTPLDEQENVDYPSFKKLIHYLIDAKVNGFFVMGTTGEFARLERDDRLKVIREAVHISKGEALIYACISDTGTKKVLENLKHVNEIKPDAIVCSLPYYFPVTDDGEVLEFYRAVAAHTNLPVMLYNIPVTSGAAISLQAVKKLLEVENIIGIKDSSGDFNYFTGLLALKAIRPGFKVLMGDESLALDAYRAGADGIVPSLANVFPKLFTGLYEAATVKDWTAADTYFQTIREMNKMNRYSDSWMSAVVWRKAALDLMDICPSWAAGPYVPVSEENRTEIKGFIEQYKEIFQII